MTILSAIRSMRLRTLPLSLAGVICGIALAWHSGANASVWCVALLLLTTVALQILSNLCNELGDFLSGTDNQQRVGPQYSLAGGVIAESEFRHLIVGVAVVCCLLGVAMISNSYGTLCHWQALALLALGALALWAAVHYTLGHRAYGRHGLGDLFVFIFFGLVSVLGGFFVIVHSLPPASYWLVGVAVGCFSIGVLNVNNLRDIESDRGLRVTIPLLLGVRGARLYHTALIVIGIASLFAFAMLESLSFWWTATIPFYLLHLVGVWRRNGRQLDPMLPLLVITTFVLSILLSADLLVK